MSGGPNPLTNGLSHGLLEVDSLMSQIKAIPKKMRDDRADCVISLTRVKESQRYGITYLSEGGKNVLQCVEKPNEPSSNLAVIGVHAFNSPFLEVYPKLKPSWRNMRDIASDQRGV